MKILHPATSELIQANGWDEFDVIAIHVSWARTQFYRRRADWCSDQFMGNYLDDQGLPVTDATLTELRERLAGRVEFIRRPPSVPDGVTICWHINVQKMSVIVDDLSEGDMLPQARALWAPGPGARLYEPCRSDWDRPRQWHRSTATVYPAGDSPDQATEVFTGVLLDDDGTPDAKFNGSWQRHP